MIDLVPTCPGVHPCCARVNPYSALCSVVSEGGLACFLGAVICTKLSLLVVSISTGMNDWISKCLGTNQGGGDLGINGL